MNGTNRRRRVGGRVLAGAVGVTLLVAAAAYWWRVEPWAIEGFAMTFCPCASPCPCRSGGHATHGACEAATFVHVVRGHYGATALDGLRFVAVGEMHAAGRRVVYVERAVPGRVRTAMRAIGASMLAPHRLAAPLARALASRAVRIREVARIDYERGPRGVERRVVVPGVLELHGRLRATADGTPTEKVPALDELGNWVAYADNLVYRYDDPAADRHLDFSGRQANFKTFRARKRDYDARRLLFQRVRDGSPAAMRRLLDTVRASDELAPRPLAH